MKNTALIAVPIALLVAAGTWYMLSARDSAEPNGLTMNSNAAAVIATVNDTKITNGELSAMEARVAASQGVDLATLDAEMREVVRASALEELVSQTLLAQASADITVEDSAVDTEFSAVRSQFETDDAYQDALAAEGFTEATLRDQIRENLRVQAYFDQTLDLDSATASDAEIEAFYNEQSSALGDGAEMPPLEELRAQIEQFVIQQKQQEMIAAHLEELRAAASVEINEE